MFLQELKKCQKFCSSTFFDAFLAVCVISEWKEVVGVVKANPPDAKFCCTEAVTEAKMASMKR